MINHSILNVKLSPVCVAWGIKVYLGNVINRVQDILLAPVEHEREPVYIAVDVIPDV